MNKSFEPRNCYVVRRRGQDFSIQITTMFRSDRDPSAPQTFWLLAVRLKRRSCYRFRNFMSFVYPTGVAKKLPSGFTLVSEQSCDACGDAVLTGIRKEDPDMWDGQVFCEHCWSNVCIRAEVMKGLAGQTIIMKKTRANISKTIRSWRDDEAGIFPCVVKYVKELLPHSMDETKLQVVFQSSCHGMSEHSHKELQDMASNGEQLWEGRGRYAGKWYCRHCWHLFWKQLEFHYGVIDHDISPDWEAEYIKCGMTEEQKRFWNECPHPLVIWDLIKFLHRDRRVREDLFFQWRYSTYWTNTYP